MRVYERGPGDSLIPVPPEAADRELIQDAIAYYSGADREYREGG